MAIRTQHFRRPTGQGFDIPLPKSDASVQLVLVFGAERQLVDLANSGELTGAFPEAIVAGCTSSGEISGAEVFDEELVIAAVSFGYTTVHAVVEDLRSAADSRAIGARISQQLQRPHLRHILLLSDGLLVNGSELVLGATSNLPPGVAVTGGLAGDGDRFKRTAVLFGNTVNTGRVIGIGLYSEHLQVGFGSLGGWDPFGPERNVTKVVGNKLFELDGKSALQLYKEYLGRHSAELPGSALLFPLTIRVEGEREPIVRTVLAVNEQEQSITFAGDVPSGSVARFMKANVERLVDGAADAAGVASLHMSDRGGEFALLISCVGRRLVLKQRVEEEVEAAQEILGPQAQMVGFYSYGEIAPFMSNAKCELHNQTMTITVLREKD